MWRAVRLLLVLMVIFSVATCIGPSGPEGPSAESGVVRITVISAEATAGDHYRVKVAVTNLRSWTEFDGEFYLGDVSLEDANGLPAGDLVSFNRLDSPPDDLYADVISPASTVEYIVEFEDVRATPRSLVYDSWESGVLRVPLEAAGTAD